MKIAIMIPYYNLYTSTKKKKKKTLQENVSLKKKYSI